MENRDKLYIFWWIMNHQKHPKMMYKYINENVIIKSTARAIKDVDDKIITDPKGTWEQFNDWFFKVFWKENYNVLPESHKVFPNCECSTFHPITMSDVIKSLNPNKSRTR